MILGTEWGRHGAWGGEIGEREQVGKRRNGRRLGSEKHHQTHRSHLGSPGYRGGVKRDGGCTHDKHTDGHLPTQMSFHPRRG